MPVRPEMLVKGLDGRPLPPPDLLARIKRGDERLGLFYTSASWAITEAWRLDDPRREWVQRQEVQPEMAFDVCGYLPITCSVDEAPAYIEHELKSYTAEEWTKLRESLRTWNTPMDHEVGTPAAGQDAYVEDLVMAGVHEELTKSGPSIGVFNVPAQLTVTPPKPDAGIASAMATVRKRKHG